MTTKQYMSFWLLTCAAMSVGHAQSLGIKTAVELRFPTVAGQGYRVLESDTLGNWQPMGHQLFGDGTDVSLLIPGSVSARFFRLDTFNVSNLNSVLEPLRVAYNIPALACAVVLSNRIAALGAVGWQKSAITNAPVTCGDKWHLGSLTKSMTATLAAIMVEQGYIKWTNTLADVFPDFASQMDPAWCRATLELLTVNRGGAPQNIPTNIWNDLTLFGGTPRDARHQLLQQMTTNPPSSTPGTMYEYSNAGFALAGHMLETVANQPWEDLLAAKLFAPLELASFGYGVPSTPHYLNQPWGHYLSDPASPPSDTNPAWPVDASPNADNPPAIGPAGTVHCCVIDLANYAAFHLAVHKGDTALLSQASGLKLHTAYPNNGGYAYGWLVLYRSWANGNALWHNGSNGLWYSEIWLAPQRDFAVVTLCNIGGDAAAFAADDAAAQMIQIFLP
jgi:CubicO group peptidase (beta-lactamase class C family)